ncbi:MAG: periplasmic heavy metal sensor [Phycisphaerae bacterium]|nr:periplasmic heavy metal sensor [Phycisphaerae bacterium]
MITKAGMTLMAVAAVVFAGAFLTTVGTTPTPSTNTPMPPLARWLGVDAETAAIIHEQDPAFTEDVTALRRELDSARARLAELFENAEASDEQIRAAVDASIAAHNELERRVSEYLIAVRKHLTPDQQKKLFGLCANEIRECRKRCQKSGCGAGVRTNGACDPTCPAGSAARPSATPCRPGGSTPGTRADETTE